MKERLTLRVDMTEADGPSLPPKPIQYSVMGLPPGEVVVIRKVDKLWRTYRSVGGKMPTQGRGDYPSATAALADLHLNRPDGSK